MGSGLCSKIVATTNNYPVASATPSFGSRPVQTTAAFFSSFVCFSTFFFWFWFFLCCCCCCCSWTALNRSRQQVSFFSMASSDCRLFFLFGFHFYVDWYLFSTRKTERNTKKRSRVAAVLTLCDFLAGVPARSSLTLLIALIIASSSSSSNNNDGNN